ncbi:MAG: glycosyltransferase family 9 protein [Bacteroidota bacterium]
MAGPKILLLRFSSIGDIVLTTPVIRCLHQQLGAEVHFLCKTAYRSLLDSNPYLSKVYSIQKQLGEVLPALRAEHYDHIIDLHNNLRTLHLQLALRKRAFRFHKLNWRKWLLVNWKIDRLPRQHIVERYLAAAQPLGLVNDGQGLDYFIPPAEREATQRYLQAQGLDPGADFVAMAIGAAHATKQLPLSQLRRICAGVKRRMVLLGGKAEQAAGAALAAEGTHLVNACGVLSLHQSAAVLQRAQLVISPDTGMMHIAAALGKPIISVWGNTVPALGMYPYYGEGERLEQRFEVPGLTCRPCSKIGHGRCPKGHFRCMMEQDIAGIIAAAGQ